MGARPRFPRFDSPPSPGQQDESSNPTPSEAGRRRYLVFRLEAHDRPVSSVRRTIVYARDHVTGRLRHLEVLCRRRPAGTEGPPDGEPPPAAPAALLPDPAPPADVMSQPAA